MKSKSTSTSIILLGAGASIGFMLSAASGIVAKAVYTFYQYEEYGSHWSMGILGNPGIIITLGFILAGSGFGVSIPVLLDKFWGKVVVPDGSTPFFPQSSAPVLPKAPPSPAPPRIRRYHV